LKVLYASKNGFCIKALGNIQIAAKKRRKNTKKSKFFEYFLEKTIAKESIICYN